MIDVFTYANRTFSKNKSINLWEDRTRRCVQFLFFLCSILGNSLDIFSISTQKSIYNDWLLYGSFEGNMS